MHYDNGVEETSRPDIPLDTRVILVADDNDDLRAGIHDIIFHILGYTVIAVENGAKLLDECRARQKAVCMIITDNDMPEVTGGEALPQIRAMGIEAPTFMLSAKDISEESKKTLISEGLTAFIQKPIEADQLIELVQRNASVEP